MIQTTLSFDTINKDMLMWLPLLLLAIIILVRLYLWYMESIQPFRKRKYIHDIKMNNVEKFSSCEPSLFSTSLKTQFGEESNIACLTDLENMDCKYDENMEMDTHKLYPIHIIYSPNDNFLAVFNDGKIYQSDDIEEEKLWRGPLENSLIKDSIALQNITFNRDGKLMGIGIDNQLYLKMEDDITSPWQTSPVPNSDCVSYVMFDKDNKLMGLKPDGTHIKKEDEDITSAWKTTNNNLPLVKMYWDLNGHLLGLTADFLLHQKQLPNWENSPWKPATSPMPVLDIVYASDGRLYGIMLNKELDMIELGKQNSAYYTSPFFPLVDVNPKNPDILILSQLINTKMGTGFKTVQELQDEGIDEDKVVDPSLMEIREIYNLQDQQKVRELCAKKKNVIKTDYYDFRLQRQIENQDKLINKMKQELSLYQKMDPKYVQALEREDQINQLSKLTPELK